MARTRRSKKEVLIDNIAKYDDEIAKLTAKIEALSDEKSKAQKEIEAIDKAELAAKDEKAKQDLIKLIEQSGMTFHEAREKLLAQ